mmetsp:Transcript_22091/g.37781  ORF Transcript_22091/g.37781 Transcript_22091/m.37781 type:complete len:1093 (-) Transcript_22091:235-3513(-)
MQTRGSKTRQSDGNEEDLERLDSGLYLDFPSRQGSNHSGRDSHNSSANSNMSNNSNGNGNSGGFGGAFRRFIKKRPSMGSKNKSHSPPPGSVTDGNAAEAMNISKSSNHKMTLKTVSTSIKKSTAAASAKPRRRRGSHAMPGGGQKLPTSAELMAQKAQQQQQQGAAAPPTSTTQTASTTTATTTTKSTKPRRARRGSHAMPDMGGQKMPTSAELMAQKQQQQAAAAAPAASPAVSSSAPVTKKMGGKKSGGRRRGSHAMPAMGGQKMPTSAELMAQKQQAAAMSGAGGEPMDMEEEPIVTATPTVPTPITAKPKSNRRGSHAMPTGMKMPTSAELMAQKEAAAAALASSSAPQDANDGPSPMDTSDSSPPTPSTKSSGGGRPRARRRGSVVKTMVDSGPKSVDGDGEHVATASTESSPPVAQQSEEMDSSMKLSESMMELDDADDHNQSGASLRPTRMSAVEDQEMGNKRQLESSRNMAHGTGGKKKDRGRKAIRAVAADLDYVHKVVPKSSDARELIYEAIKPNLLFRACSTEEMYDLVDAFEPQYVPMGSVVIQEGDEGDHFYVMEKGGVDVYEKDVHKCSLYSGIAFGEIALLYSCPRTATVQAKYDCKLWVINRRAFRGITAQHKKRRLEMKSDFLKKVKIHDKVLGDILKSSEINSMALATKVQKFKAGNAIVRQGERGDAFYMIEEGKVDVYINEKGARPIVTLQKGSFFGEKALLSSDTRTATCVASTDVKCMLIGREDFVLMLGNLQDLLDRSYIARDEALREKQEASPYPTTRRFNMDDYVIKRTLGVGAFGFVKLVQWKNSPKGKEDQWYALKCVSKQKIEQHKQQEKIKREEEIMKELIHPFIARLYAGMEDEKGKYFLMEALCGGELCELLYNETQFSERWSLFYSASVLSAFGHMHERKIAYRDLKPENLVLDTLGYVKIVDFGLAKKVKSGQTYTFCGTPDYLAPEVILNEGYDWGVDYWGLGVLIYEMGAGVAPFYAENPMDTYRKALSGQVPMPEKFSRALVSIIKKLLHTSQTKRLGRTAGGATTVMCHRWFSNFDWDGLMECRLKPPIKPEIKSPEEESGSSHDVEGFAIDFL